MMSLLTKILGVIFDKNEIEKERKISYFKSLIFLTLIVIWVAEEFMGFNLVENIMYLLSDKEMVDYILIIMQIGVQFFTTLVVIALVIMIISGIIYEVIKEHSNNNKQINYFSRMKAGSELRLENSIENIIICLGIGMMFDNQFLNIYQNIYINIIVAIILTIYVLVVINRILKGVLNRFFVFWTDFYMLDENK